MDQVQPSNSNSKLPLILSILAIVLILVIAGTIYYLNSNQLVNFEKVITNKIDDLADKVDSTEKSLETILKEKIKPSSADSTDNTTEKTTKQFGFIEGSLGYPSTGIPTNMTICAIEKTTKEKHCTSDKIKDTKYINDTGYKLKVPVGTYNIFANSDMSKDLFGFYTKAWECNYKEAPMKNCEDHALVPVQVIADKTTTNINLLDYYTNLNPNNL